MCSSTTQTHLSDTKFDFAGLDMIFDIQTM